MVPRENKNNAYAKLGGTNKEYYGIFRNGLLWCNKLPWQQESPAKTPYILDLVAHTVVSQKRTGCHLEALKLV